MTHRSSLISRVANNSRSGESDRAQWCGHVFAGSSLRLQLWAVTKFVLLFRIGKSLGLLNGPPVNDIFHGQFADLATSCDRSVSDLHYFLGDVAWDCIGTDRGTNLGVQFLVQLTTFGHFYNKVGEVKIWCSLIERHVCVVGGFDT